MTLDKIFVAAGGVGLIFFIWWFFFGKKEEATISGGVVEILVSGGYKPEKIKIKKGEKTKLIILRKDPNSCLEEIVIPDFKIKKYLPLNKKIEIEITPKKAGIYRFQCGMNMFHGELVVD